MKHLKTMINSMQARPHFHITAAIYFRYPVIETLLIEINLVKNGLTDK